MEEIRVGMRFQNRSNGRIGYVARIDEVGKCADIMYEEVAEGQSKGGRASLSGLKGQKSWKYLHDETETTVQRMEEVKEEEVASDGTPYTEVMAEIQQDEQNLADKYVKEKKQAEPKAEKPKKEKKERKKREVNTHIDEILDYIYECVEKLGGNIGVPRDAEMKFRALRKEDGKQFCKLMWSGKSVKLFTKIKLDQYGCYAINYPLPNVYEFEHCHEKIIKDVLTNSFNECAGYKTKKTKKEKKED